MRDMTTIGRGLVAALAAAFLTIHAPAATHAADEVRQQRFESACRARMDELQRQEAANLEGIEWTERLDGVRGTYVGYSPAYRCILNDSGTSGRMAYQEVVYEKHGSNRQAALLSVPRPLEIREVTLILVEADGVWR